MILRSVILFISVGLCLGQYEINNKKGYGRQFFGIGAMSSGGASSKMLYNYPEKERDEILDYLFKPSFGAALQVLHVEIGGDTQSSEGSESSHMHESWDENYERGYQWWLMKEAKKRNKKMKFVGLANGFPGWVGDAANTNPYLHISETAAYVAKWAGGTWDKHHIQMNYVGVWNERQCNAEYIKELQNALRRYSCHTYIVACDSLDWNYTDSVLHDKTVLEHIDIIGVHNTGSKSSEFAKNSNKQIWSVETPKSPNTASDHGCLARILNRNYVNGLMTSTVTWDLITSYYGEGFAQKHIGLINADQPWSGHYDARNPIWMAAHTTQFTKNGWTYLNHGHGVGMLKNGGSYVTLASPGNKDFTIVIETMSHEKSKCADSPVPHYNVSDEIAEFVLEGNLATIEKFHVWRSDLNENTFFERMGPIKPGKTGNKFKMYLKPNQIYTLTTLNTGSKGSFITPPKPKSFPNNFFDDFQDTDVFKDSKYFVSQHGAWEVRMESKGSSNRVNRQVVTSKTINWCSVEPDITINMGGNHEWKDVDVSIDVKLPTINGTTGAFIGARVKDGGCEAANTSGVYFAVFPDCEMYKIYSDSSLTHPIFIGELNSQMKRDSWHNIAMSVKGYTVTVSFDGNTLSTIEFPHFVENGYVAYGTTDFGLADFDNILAKNA